MSEVSQRPIPSTVIDLRDHVFFIMDDQDPLSGQKYIAGIRVSPENTREVVPGAPQWRFTVAGGLTHIELPDGKLNVEPVVTVIRAGAVPTWQLINVLDQALGAHGWIRADTHWPWEDGADLLYCRLMPDGYVFQLDVPTVNLTALAISEIEKSANRDVDNYIRMLRAIASLHGRLVPVLVAPPPRNWPQVIYHQTDTLLKLGEIQPDASVRDVETAVDAIRFFIKAHCATSAPGFEVFVDLVGGVGELTITIGDDQDAGDLSGSAAGEDTNMADTSDRAWQQAVTPTPTPAPTQD